VYFGTRAIPLLHTAPQVEEAGSYSAEAQQFFDRIADPGATRKNAYAAIIDATVLAGVWSKLDAFYILAADIQANALINLKSSSYTASIVGAVTFTADQGFVGGAAGKYLDTNLNAVTASGNYAQNSAHISVWSRTDVAEIVAAIGVETGNQHIFPRYVDENCYFRINATAGGLSNANGSGFFLGNRSGAGATEGYRNGASLGTGTDASDNLVNLNFLICAGSGDGGCTRELAVASFGGSLNSTEGGDFYTALNTNKWW
jgi:hypothetical protein